MKKEILTISFILLISLSFVSATIPKITPYVNDFAGVLNDNQKLQLNLLCDSIEKNTSWEIAIVTVANTGGEDRVQFANEVGDQNGVGKKDKDNGIVVLWSMDNQQGGAIATGRYSESIFNDAKVGRIGRASRPYFDNESYYEGFNYIIGQIQYEIANVPINATLPNEQSQTGLKGFGFLLIIIGLLIFGVAILPIIISSNGSDYESSDRGSRSSFRVSTGSSSSGGFSGGKGFGGGSFGGGGAGF